MWLQTIVMTAFDFLRAEENFEMILTITAIVSTVCALLYAYMRYSRRRFYEFVEKIPGPPGELPLIGHAHKLAFLSHNEVYNKILDFTKQEELKDVMKVWLGPKLYVTLLHPKDIELVLSSSIHLEKTTEYFLFEPWFGNGLLISKGETWSKHRKLIAPTFHLNVLKRFMDQFNARGRSVVEKMRQEKGKEFDCHNYMSECTVETLVSTVMGVKQDFQNKTCYNYAKAVMEMCDIFHSRHLKLWMKSDLIFNITGTKSKHDELLKLILGFTKRVFNTKKMDVENKKYSATVNEEVKDVSETVADVNEKFSFGKSSLIKDDIDDDAIGEKKRLPFLESMIETASTGSGMTHEEIENQVNTLMFEGHDTTASGLSSFLCVMAAHPEIQDKCSAEIESIFGDSDRDITFQDTIEMKYIERCIMETLRMFPPVPLIARKLKSDLKLASKDVVLPSGTSVAIGIIRLHRRDEIYNNPDEFDPDNFLPEKAANRHYYSFIPFSAGPRSCVGRKYAMLKIKIIAAYVLRNFRVTGGKPIKDWKMQADIILKRTDGFNISLEPKKGKAMS